MEFTIFTLLISIFWVSLFAALIPVLRRRMSFLKYFSIYPLILLVVFCILRLFLPVEWPFTRIINSRKILPPIQTFLREPFLQTDVISITPSFILLGIWGIGICITALRRLCIYYRFQQFLNRQPDSHNPQIEEILCEINPHNPLRNAKIIIHPSIKSPAVLNYIHPILLLPDMSFSKEELLGILMHESAHYKYGHLIVKYITECICIFFWWNPFFKKLSAEMEHLLEMHSDNYVCRNLDKKQQKVYLSCIVRILENLRKGTYSSPSGCSLVAYEDDEKLKQRFQMILSGAFNSKKKWDFLIVPTLILLFLLSYLVVLQPYSEPSQEDVDSGQLVTSEYFFVKTDSGYALYDPKHHYITTIAKPEGELLNLKIYEKLEDAP